MTPYSISSYIRAARYVAARSYAFAAALAAAKRGGFYHG